MVAVVENVDVRQRRQMNGRRDVSTISCSRSPNISAKVNPSQVHPQHHAAYHHRAMNAVAAVPPTIVEVVGNVDEVANLMFKPTPAPTATQAEKVNKTISSQLKGWGGIEVIRENHLFR